MATNVKASKTAMVNLDLVAAVIHDDSGFESASGQTKSVRIILAGGPSITVLESDPGYADWLNYLQRAGTLMQASAL